MKITKSLFHSKESKIFRARINELYDDTRVRSQFSFLPNFFLSLFYSPPPRRSRRRLETRDSLPVLDRGKSIAKSKDPAIDGAWQAVWISLRRLIREYNNGIQPEIRSPRPRTSLEGSCFISMRGLFVRMNIAWTNLESLLEKNLTTNIPF